MRGSGGTSGLAGKFIERTVVRNFFVLGEVLKRVLFFPLLSR